MRRVVRTLRAILGRGRLLTRWSAIATLPVALTIMGPYLALVSPGTVPALLLAALLSWAIPALLLWGAVRLAENRVSRRARALLVGIPVLVLAAARPILTDRFAVMLGVDAAPAQWLPFRIATNLLVWPILLLAIAVLVASFRARRSANERLASALERMRGDERRLGLYDAEARGAVAACAEDLRTRLGRLDASDPGAVRAFAIGSVRGWSHRISVLAERGAGDSDAGETPGTVALRTVQQVPAPVHGQIRRPPLRVPPVGTVALGYGVAVLPYALSTLDPVDLLVSTALILSCGMVIDFAARRFRRGAMLVPLLWGVAGIAIAVGQARNGAVPAHYAWVPAIALPAAALIACRLSALVHGMRAEERRLEAALRERRRRLAEGGANTERTLRAVAGVLHRDVQGACVRLVAEAHSAGPSTARSSAASASELRAVLGAAVRGLDGAFERTGAGGGAPAGERLAATLESWGRVLDLRIETTEEAQRELDRSDPLAERTLEVVIEGLVNAVKHSDTRSAVVRATRVPTGGGPMLRVEVAAPGIIPPAAALRRDAPAAALGAELVQRGADAVLCAELRIPAVVPAAHPPETVERSS